MSETIKQLDGDTEIDFQIQLLRTPNSTVSSSSFKVYSKDADNRIVNFIESDLFVTMLRGKTITGIKVTSSSYIVGQLAEHTFTFDAPIPLYPTN